MIKHDKAAIDRLSEQLQVPAEFLQECLKESVIEIREINGLLDLDNGTFLHLRRVERLCHTFEVDVPTALLLRDLRRRIAELEVRSE